jgi:FAD/FMN-containing dehydrogenase
METFDDTTLWLGIKFMPEIAKKAGKSFLSFALQFWPEAIISLKLGGLPKLIVLVQIAEDTKKEADRKVAKVVDALKDNALHYRVIDDMQEAEKFWIMRRESFNLLRQKVKHKQTVPFIEDFCVKPEVLPEFLPQLMAILKEHGIKANIAGHAGEGNLHIIPLMDLHKQSERDKIVPVANIVYDLIIKYKGTITAEHNDGILRTPYVKQMFGADIYSLFEKVKAIFDPHNIFNPGKKVGGTLAYMESHIVGK